VNHSEIQALARLLDRLDYYRLLRVAPASPLSEIRDSYRAARRQFHPDAFSHAPTEVGRAVERIARRLTEAYTVLRDPARRAAYDRGLQGGALRMTADADESARRERDRHKGTTPNGRRFAALALEAEGRGDVSAAIAHWKLALTFESRNESFRQKLSDLEAKLGAPAR
jgi:curved DNA-binding protein CbpA